MKFEITELLKTLTKEIVQIDVLEREKLKLRNSRFFVYLDQRRGRKWDSAAKKLLWP